MTSLDTIILIILAVFALLGLVRGLLQQVASIIAFFLSIFIAGHFYLQAAVVFKDMLDQYPYAEPLSHALGFVVIYFIATFALGILIKFLDSGLKIFSKIPLVGITNRLGGAAIGVVEGILLVSAIVFVLGVYPWSPKIVSALKESTFAPKIVYVSKLLLPLFPDVTKLAPSVFDPNAIFNFTLPTEIPKELKTIVPKSTSSSKKVNIKKHNETNRYPLPS